MFTWEQMRASHVQRLPNLLLVRQPTCRSAASEQAESALNRDHLRRGMRVRMVGAPRMSAVLMALMAPSLSDHGNASTSTRRSGTVARQSASKTPINAPDSLSKICGRSHSCAGLGVMRHVGIWAWVFDLGGANRSKNGTQSSKRPPITEDGARL